MLDWKCYSTTDMVNWTDHGSIASLKIFQWARQDNDAWAPQCIERDGKFYIYCPVSQTRGGMAIGVAVSDSPFGPFTDPSENLWSRAATIPRCSLITTGRPISIGEGMVLVIM